MTNPELLAQATVDVLAYFLPAFSIMLGVAWLVSLFRFRS